MSVMYAPILYPGQMVFEKIDGQETPCPVLGAFISLTGSATNIPVVAAVSGKKIRVLSICLTSAANMTQPTLKNGSGGAVIYQMTCPANTGEHPDVVRDLNPFGWCETSTGVGLYADAGTTTQNIQVRYVAYTLTT
jgi:hypothetical protein